MKLIFYYLIPAYFDIFFDAIELDGEPLPVYDGQVPPDVTGSYILIGERNAIQTKAKGRYNFECNVLIDVVIKGANYGFKDSEDCANQIMALINSDQNPVCQSSFQVVTTNVESVNNLAGLNPTDNVFRTLIRYSHKVNQI